MTDLNKLIDEVLELDVKATKGPWNSDFCGDVWTISGEVPHVNDGGMELFRGIGSTVRGPDNGDAALIAHYRTAAPILARELKERMAGGAGGIATINCDGTHLREMLKIQEELSGTRQLYYQVVEQRNDFERHFRGSETENAKLREALNMIQADARAALVGA